MARIPSKNLNMARINLEDEKPTKKYWSLKRLKLGPKEQGPLQHKHILLLALGPNFKHTKLLHFGCL
jgi:hypothetical protein